MKYIAILMIAIMIANKSAMCSERMFPKYTAGKWTAQIETRGITGHILPYQEYRVFRHGPDDPSLIEVLPWQQSHWFAGFHLREDGLLVVKDDHLGNRVFFPKSKTAADILLPKLNFCLSESAVKRATKVMGDSWLLDDVLLFSRELYECQQIGYFRINHANETISPAHEIVEVTSSAAAIDPRVGVMRLGDNLIWVNRRGYGKEELPAQWRESKPQIFNIKDNAPGALAILTPDLVAKHPLWFYYAYGACRKSEDPAVAKWSEAVAVEMRKNRDIVRAALREKELKLEQLYAE